MKLDEQRKDRRRFEQSGTAKSRVLITISSLMATLVMVACPTIWPPSNGNDGTTDPGSEPTQAILDLEEKAFDLVNDEREAAGLSRLDMDIALRTVARQHSRDMVDRNFFDHENPDGESPFDRLDNAGIGFRMAAENIAWNNFPNPAETAVDGWMESEGHRRNILTASFSHTGMGVASNGEGGYYFTQLFVDPAKGATPADAVVLYFEPLSIVAE